MHSPHRTTRQRWLGLAAAAALTFGFVTTTAMVVHTTAGKPEPTFSADAGAITDADRAAAAERADRATRATAPASPPSSPSSAAPTAPSAAPSASAAAPVVEAPPAWVSPMPDAPLSSCFGSRWGSAHLGLDFAGASGTAIRAVGAGTVLTAGWQYAGYGESVMIDHGDGTLTHYAHASRVLVRPGQAVVPGQAIALEGSTGNSSGPHLHFEVHLGLWHQVDPAAWLRDHGVPIAC